MGVSGTGGRELLLHVRVPLSLCWYGPRPPLPFFVRDTSCLPPETAGARGAVEKPARTTCVVSRCP